METMYQNPGSKDSKRTEDHHTVHGINLESLLCFTRLPESRPLKSAHPSHPMCTSQQFSISLSSGFGCLTQFVRSQLD